MPVNLFANSTLVSESRSIHFTIYYVVIESRYMYLTTYTVVFESYYI